MKNIITLLGIVLLLTSCNSAKRNEKLLARGDYGTAIELAVKKLQRDKTAARNDSRIGLLEEAFKKAIAQDKRHIASLQKQNDVASARKIFYTYQNMEYLQDQIRPLLPLYSTKLGRNAKFDLVNYDDKIHKARAIYITSLYDEGQWYMQRQSIKDYRTAYNIFCEIEELDRSYKNVAQLKDDARFYGTDFVFVTLNNRSGQIMPIRLERELLDFNTYGLDNFWTEYHNRRNSEIEYNYGIALNFREISISPETVDRVTERRTKRIKDGWQYKLDRNGNVAKDSLGNDIKIDKYITVSAQLTFTDQRKAAFVGGNVVYRDLLNRRDLNSYPLSSEFIFENTFAEFRGDKRALNNEDLNFLRNQFIPFPSTEQLVFDAGENIKIRLKEILKNNTLN